jgi:hypothetical protein
VWYRTPAAEGGSAFVCLQQRLFAAHSAAGRRICLSITYVLTLFRRAFDDGRQSLVPPAATPAKAVAAETKGTKGADRKGADSKAEDGDDDANEADDDIDFVNEFKLKGSMGSVIYQPFSTAYEEPFEKPGMLKSQSSSQLLDMCMKDSRLQDDQVCMCVCVYVFMCLCVMCYVCYVFMCYVLCLLCVMCVMCVMCVCLGFRV